MNKELTQIIKKLSVQFGIEAAALASFIMTETGGKGFDDKTGKILIQFEPKWFKKHVPYAPSGAWSVNKVDVQTKEWIAFNDAFAKNADGAMRSTSIGLGQIMGFHYKRLGFKTVGEMWDHAKKSLENQVWQICQFIETDKELKKAIVAKNWHVIASIYNGSGYLDLARKIGREPYNITMERNYAKLKPLFVNTPA